MNTQRKFKKWLPILLAMIMIATVFAGCGGGGSSTSEPAAPAESSEDTSTAESTEETEPSEAPAETTSTGGNILRFGTTGVEGKFNPIMSDQVYDTYVVDMIFEPLVKYDATGAYVPTSICTYEISEDNLTYTFTLTDGVKFSDGTPMTSADVAFTFETIAHKDYNGPRANAVMIMVGYEAYHSGESDTFEAIKIIDDKTISFTFKEAGPANLATSFIYAIMPKHYYEFETWEQFLALLDKPMGSGRLVLDDFQPKQYVDLVKNENYWDPSTALKIDGVIISEVPEESCLGALTTGQIDFYQQTNANPDTYAAIESAANVTPHTFLGNGYTYMCFNTTRTKLSDVKVRQALMYALDRKSFIEAQYGSELGSVGLAPFSPTSWAMPDTSTLNAYDYDMAKAEALMDEAGWVKGADGIREKDGERMSLTWLVYTEASWPGNLSGMAADSWKQLGVELNIELLDFNTVSDRAIEAEPGSKDFDIYTMGFSLDAEPDPSGALFDYEAYSAGGFNASGYKNDRAQELIALGRTEFDQEKRKEYYNEFAKLMNEEIPTIIIAYRSDLWAIGDHVKGLETMGSFKDWIQCLPDVTMN